jgi:threonylcarbamoyladenosine tRNA methylthiotransferase MtaB
MAVEVLTLGCRLNAAESETIRRLAEREGVCDAIVINTCAVTAEAVRQARQTIRRAHRERPDQPIIVTGCAAQTEAETFAAMPEVARVIGNAEKLEGAIWRGLPSQLLAPSGERAKVSDIATVRAFAGHMAEAYEGQTRAFLQVQNGCDHRCTFCIIPYGRGPSRSAPMGDVVTQAQRLVDRGFAEIVLTGVDLTSYGPDLPGSPTLGKLVKAILRHAPGLKRLRLSSIDSVEIDDDFIDAMTNEPRLMPFLHLSLQSGSDLILKRMKRRHLAKDALRFVEKMSALRPGIAFGADFIAGFPTEGTREAEETIAHAKACGIAFMHVFPYSARTGTPAARMPQLAPALIKERARALREVGQELLAAHLDGLAGKVVTVLSERGGVGRAGDFTPVRLPVETPYGALMPFMVNGHDGKSLTGKSLIGQHHDGAPSETFSSMAAT